MRAFPVNPALVLAGAAAANGNTQLAADIMVAGRANRDAKAMKKRSKRMAGFSCLSVAIVENRKIQSVGVPSVSVVYK